MKYNTLFLHDLHIVPGLSLAFLQSYHIPVSSLIVFFFFFFFKDNVSLFNLCSAGKESACNAGDLGSVPRLGSFPGEGNGYALQYFGLENSMECTVHGVTKSQTQLSAPSYPGIFVCVISPI